jgi:hypothetical protein
MWFPLTPNTGFRLGLGLITNEWGLGLGLGFRLGLGLITNEWGLGVSLRLGAGALYR